MWGLENRDKSKRGNPRVLINKRRCVVDLVMYYDVEILFGVVFGDIGKGKFFRHGCGEMYVC